MFGGQSTLQLRQMEALDALLGTLKVVIPELPADAHGTGLWQASAAGYVGRRWVDALAVLRRQAAMPGAAAAIAGRAQAALAADRLKVVAYDFWCAPGTFRDLPVDLADDLSQAVVVIVKGDLNYRRLVGDTHWDPETPFADVTGYFPAPVAALPVCKSDVAVGVAPERLAHLEATARGRRTDSTHAVIHVSPLTRQAIGSPPSRPGRRAPSFAGSIHGCVGPALVQHECTERPFRVPKSRQSLISRHDAPSHGAGPSSERRSR